MLTADCHLLGCFGPVCAAIRWGRLVSGLPNAGTLTLLLRIKQRNTILLLLDIQPILYPRWTRCSRCRPCCSCSLLGSFLTAGPDSSLAGLQVVEFQRVSELLNCSTQHQLPIGLICCHPYHRGSFPTPRYCLTNLETRIPSRDSVCPLASTLNHL